MDAIHSLRYNNFPCSDNTLHIISLLHFLQIWNFNVPGLWWTQWRACSLISVIVRPTILPPFLGDPWESGAPVPGGNSKVAPGFNCHGDIVTFLF